MSDNYQPLNSINLQNGLNVSSPLLSPASLNTLADSYNLIVSGDGFIRPVGSPSSQGTGWNIGLQFGNTYGGIRSYQYSDVTFSAPSAVGTNQVTVANSYVTGLACQVSSTITLPTGLAAATTYYLIVQSSTVLKFASTLANALAGTAIPITASTGSGTVTIDVTNAAVTASGNFFQDIGLSRWGIGAGQPVIETTAVPGYTLSTNLQVQIPASGVYGVPVQAGLSQPSAPEVGIVSTSGTVSNSVSVKIERTRPSTGANSVASPNSAVINPQQNRVRVTFPIAQSGQEAWRVFFTFQGFGGTGVNYLLQYGGENDITEAIVAAGVVDGIARSLEFNYVDGDLVPLEASFDDYPPPAATHAMRLNTVMNVIGCYSDSVSDPTTTNPGTCIAVSKENNYESYIPTSLLYLPEQVVDVLSRPSDDYGYVAGRNSVTAIQYVGDRGDSLPPCILTTVLPDIGIEYPQNWCQFRGQLLLYTAQGNLLLMQRDGSFDSTFAGPVSKILKSFTTASTSVGYDPRNDSIIVANGKYQLVYSIQADQWRKIFLPDFGITATGVSMTAAKQNLYFTVGSGSTLTAYRYDASSATTPVAVVSNYQNSGGTVLQDIYEMAVAVSTNVSTRCAVVINSNLSQTVFREITTDGSTTVTTPNADFTSDMVGKKVILFGTNIGGGSTVLLQTTVSSYTNTGAIVLGASPAALTNVLMFVGNYAASVAVTSPDHIPNFFPNLVEVRSAQYAFWTMGSDTGNILTCDVMGAVYTSSRAL